MGCNCNKNKSTYKAQGGSYNVLNALADSIQASVGVKDEDEVYCSAEIHKERLKICFSCTRLVKLTKQCRECGCFVHAKTRFNKSVCPLGKWHAVNEDGNVVQ